MVEAEVERNERVFKNREFAVFARRQRISDGALCVAVKDVRRGLIDADLGGGVIKQRIARPGAGKSGGFRSILAFRVERHTFFIFGFAKNERENIAPDDLKRLKELAKQLFALDAEPLQAALDFGALTEVICDAEEI